MTTQYRFTLTGITPLIMHADDIEARDEVMAIRKKLKNGNAGDDRSPASTWKTYLYASPDSGNICIPSENLLAMLLKAGMKVKLRGQETLKAHSQFIEFTQLDCDLLVNGRAIPKAAIDAIDGEFADHSNAARGLGFRLFVKSCAVGKSKHIRVRPIFHDWSVAGQFEIDDDDAEVLTSAALTDLWTVAGRRVGLGDWRPGAPNRPGRYGRFSADIIRL